MPGSDLQVREVLDFWFGAPGSPLYGKDRAEWFRKDAAFDKTIRRRFAPLVERALRGELAEWGAETADGALAQIVLLDQFTRNIFRDTPRAFAGDPRALAASQALVGSRQDEALAPIERSFAYLPFEHAEGMAMQTESMRLFGRLAAAAPEMAHRLDFAQRHFEIVERFGRFPHRNHILGRQSTAEELVFLATPGSGF